MKRNWAKEELGRIFFTTSGGTPSRKNASYYRGNIPWVKSGELDKGIIFDTEEKISEDALKNSSAKLFPKGTLLIALYGATIGKLAFLGIEASTNQAICGIFSSDSIDSKFLYYYLLCRRPELVSQGAGGAQPNISQTILKKLELPFPSKPEQRAIVSKIENLFTSLDRGIADLKKAKEQLKIYRQAVLKKAFEGELTKEWRKSLKHDDHDLNIAAESKVKYKTQGSGDVPEGWKWVKLGEVCEKAEKIKRKEMPSEQKFLYLDIGGIDNSTNKIVGHRSFNWGEAPSRAQQIVKVGDILFSTVRTYLKNIAQVTNTKFNDEICSSGFTVIRGILNILDSKYVYYVSLSDAFLNPLNALQTGTSYPAVRDKDVFNQQIPLSPLEEQHQIVREIESRLSVCDKVEQSITEGLKKAEALRQSILKKAFEGKLLSESEIDKCKQEADYEPASVLLERIKNEKKK